MTEMCVVSAKSKALKQLYFFAIEGFCGWNPPDRQSVGLCGQGRSVGTDPGRRCLYLIDKWAVREERSCPGVETLCLVIVPGSMLLILQSLSVLRNRIKFPLKLILPVLLQLDHVKTPSTMSSFLFPRPRPSRNGEELPSSSDLQSACLAFSPTELQRLIVQQERSLLDACAQKPDIEVAICYLSRLHPSALYPEPGTIRRRPDSLTPAQHLLECAAHHGNAALVRYLLATYTDIDFHSQILEATALTGGVEIRKALLEKAPTLKNMHYGHSGSVVEHCVMRDRPEVLRYLLEQGAKVEDEGHPILHKAEIAESSEEIRRILREFGAHPTLRIDNFDVALSHTLLSCHQTVFDHSIPGSSREVKLTMLSWSTDPQ